MADDNLFGAQLLQANLQRDVKQPVGVHSGPPEQPVGGGPVHELPADGYEHSGDGGPSGAGEQAVCQLIGPGHGSFLFKGTGAAVENGIEYRF